MNRPFLRLKHPISAGIWPCALVLVVCLSARLFWRATQMESGMGALGLQWRDATLGWVLGAYEPIDSREPAEQAEYWLREVDRVLEAHPNDAALTMGAALVLDSPGEGFVWRYRKLGSTLTPGRVLPDLDVLAIRRAKDAFRRQCHRRCLELAATAARLDPTNVQWWRLYAVLLYRRSWYCDDATPCDPDWLSTLDECARHDPDNALYDYLAARFCWRAAAEVVVSDAKRGLVIKDAEKFRQAIRRFEQGKAKPYFSVGDADSAAVADFLTHTRTPLRDHECIVNRRPITRAGALLLLDVTSCQDIRGEDIHARFRRGTGVMPRERAFV
ncbi:MAG: hypothetical protein NTW96_20475 [Planctomycetia bacterium]|nr:hypothetical protein [Planctomycetia bacterium]